MRPTMHGVAMILLPAMLAGCNPPPPPAPPPPPPVGADKGVDIRAPGVHVEKPPGGPVEVDVGRGAATTP